MMKKLFFVALLFMFFVQLAEAKTVLYVTNSSTDTPCSSLPKEDSLYCKRLSEKGYNILILNEMHIKENSTTWSEYVKNSDMIFLGSVSLNMINRSKFQDSFCGNISSKLANKTIFASFENTIIDKTKNLEGCVFHPSINLVSFDFSNNNCSKKTLKVSKTGYITEGYNLNDNLDFYSTPKTINIHKISDKAWFTAECIPPNGTIDFYPVVSVNSKGVFWGLSNPSNFTEENWNIFDRTVLYSLNDTGWMITSFVVPSVATLDQNILVLANVTKFEKPVEGTVNLTADGLYRNMEYSNGLWRVPDLRLREERRYQLIINAYSLSGLRGTSVIPINAGSLRVEIVSGNYKPNSEYVVSAKIFLGSTPQPAQASFRILDATNYNNLFIGSLNCVNNTCTNKITSIPNIESLILEVTAYNYSLSKYGGNFKIITKEPLVTDKEVYKPGESININFFSSGITTKANLTIIRPDDSKETPSPIPMDMVTERQWKKTYSLGTAVPNGTYILNLKATIDNQSLEFNKSFDVLAWEPYAYLNQYSFYAYEPLEITVGAKNTYSSSLNFSAKADVVDPDGNNVFSDTGLFKGEGKYSTSYLMPANYKSGISLVEVFLTDSDGRNATLSLNFSFNFVGAMPSLFVTPSTISEITIKRKVLTKTITLENSAENISITNLVVNISSSLMDVVEIKYKPPSIQPKRRETMIIVIKTGDNPEGRYRGTIDLLSQVGEAQISVDIEIIGDILSEISVKTSELDNIEKNITYLKKNLINVTEASALLDETRNLFRTAQINYGNENYADAKINFEEASADLEKLTPMVNELYASIPDYSFVIWYSAFGIVLAIIIVTVVKYGKKIKQAAKKKKKKEEEEEVEEVYFKPEHEEYRTEYY